MAKVNAMTTAGMKREIRKLERARKAVEARIATLDKLQRARESYAETVERWNEWSKPYMG